MKNCLLLTGEDTYRLHEREQYYVQGFSTKYPDGIVHTVQEPITATALSDVCFSAGLFSTKTLVVLRQVFTKALFEDLDTRQFFDQLANTPDTTLIIIDPKPDKRLKSTKYLLKNTTVEPFDVLDGPQTMRWVSDYAAKKSIDIPPQCIQTLVDYCGTDLWHITSELKKLQHYPHAITTAIIHELCVPHPQSVIWDFTASLSKKQQQKALQELQTLMQMGESPHQVLAMMMREARIHALLHYGIANNIDKKQLAKETKLHPFVVSKTIKLSQGFSAAALHDWYSQLIAIDQDIKTGKILLSTNDQSALVLRLEQCIVRVCG